MALTTEVRGDGSKVNGLVYKDRTTDEMQAHRARRHLRADRPAAQHRLAEGHASTCRPRGEIEIDAKGQTSVPGVFAAGDCTTVPYKQIVIAMGDGATASLSAFDHLIRTSAPA